MSQYLYLWDKKELTPEEEEIKKYLTRNQYQLIIEDENGLKARQEFDETINSGEWKKIQEKINDPFIQGIIRFVDYKDLCEQFYKNQPVYYDKSGIWWVWDFKSRKYEMMDEVDIMNRIDYAIRNSALNTSKSSIKNEILESLKKIGRKHTPETPPKNWIQFKNYVYDILTGEKFEPTPKYFFVNPIPHNISQKEDTPIIDKYFQDWVGEDKQLLYEIIGYCLYIDYPIHRIFCFTGTGRNGKSTYMELIRRVIGKENITGTELDQLIDNRFESAKLFKKLVCMMGETNYNNLKNTSLLKRLCGQDLIGYEFKNKNPFDDYNYAKILIATNGIPITHDKSEGFYRRWIIIDFPNKFPEGLDILKEISEVEYENLCFKCVKFLKNVLTLGKFTGEHSIEEKAKKYEERSNPLNKFLKERTVKDFESFVYKYEFKERFISWQRQNGFRAWNDMEIATVMKEQFEEKQKGEHGYRAWMGLKWVENSIPISIPVYSDFEVNDDSQTSQASHPFHTQKFSYESKCKYPVNPVNLVSWDDQIQAWQPCKICKETPTNEYSNGHFYCKKHFEQIQKITKSD